MDNNPYQAPREQCRISYTSWDWRSLIPNPFLCHIIVTIVVFIPLMSAVFWFSNNSIQVGFGIALSVLIASAFGMLSIAWRLWLRDGYKFLED